MIDRKTIYAVAEDGTLMRNHAEWLEFQHANPTVFTIRINSRVTITDRKLLSFNQSGAIGGFDFSSKGTPLLLINWLQGAAPLRVSIKSIMPRPPRKFWMVIPYNEQVRNQQIMYDARARRNGTAPATHRFQTREEAEHYVRNETIASGFNTYAILESTVFITNGISLAI